MNLTNIMLQQIAPILVAIGMLFVILTGGIDLSVGSIMALGASLCAILITEAGMAWGLAIIVSVAVCALLGIATGILVAYLKFQGFVASLAMMTIARGIAFMLTNGSPIKMEDGTLNTLVKSESGYPILIIGLVIILAFIFIQHFTSYGRIVIATGSNITAVELAGIRVKNMFRLSTSCLLSCQRLRAYLWRRGLQRVRLPLGTDRSWMRLRPA